MQAKEITRATRRHATGALGHRRWCVQLKVEHIQVTLSPENLRVTPTHPMDKNHINPGPFGVRPPPTREADQEPVASHALAGYTSESQGCEVQGPRFLALSGFTTGRQTRALNAIG